MKLRIRPIRRHRNHMAPSEAVHLHLQSDGQARICDVAHCESPGLTLSEVSHAAVR